MSYRQTNRFETEQRDDRLRQVQREGRIQPIGEILEELLAQYQVKFPELNITLVETMATPV